MSRELESEQHLKLVTKAIQCFFVAIVAVTISRVAIASVFPLFGFVGIQKDLALWCVKVIVICYVCGAIYRLRDQALWLSFASMSVMLLVPESLYMLGELTTPYRRFLSAVDAIGISLLVVVVYRLAMLYAAAKSAIDDEFMQELANGTSTRIGDDFLASLASSAVRILNANRVCITAALSADKPEQIVAVASRHGEVPPELSLGQVFDVHRLNRNGERVEAFPLTSSSDGLMGHISLLHDGGLAMTKRQASTLRVFVARATAELERKKLDEANSALESKMLQVQKLESLGVMAGGIAHDFNNLLAAISASSSVLNTQMEVNEKANESLSVIDSAVERGAVLCDRLLAYGGFAVQKNDNCCINRLIREIHTVVAAMYPDRVFELQLTDDDTHVWGDEAQLSQVLLNLMTNAVEATSRSDGSLIIRTKSRGCVENCPTDRSEPDSKDGFVHIEVLDRGRGMSPEEMERIFDPFYTTKGQGRGLGLAAVMGIVRQHGGEIQTLSQPDEGSTFRVLLPRSLREVSFAADSQPGVERMASPPLGLCVLLVDDNKLVRDASAGLLEANGLTVVSAANGLEAIEVYQKMGDIFDAMLLDQTMPGLSGVETFLSLRKMGASGRGILVSGYSASNQIECPAELTFLSKPFSTKDVLAAVADIEPSQQGNSDTQSVQTN